MSPDVESAAGRDARGREVVAIPRRDRVVLAVALREAGAGSEGPRVEVVAEDGARFPIAAAHLVARFPDALPAGPESRLAEALQGLRRAASRPLDWGAAHRSMAESAVLTFEEVARAVGARDRDAQIGVAMALAGAEPWLRRTGGGWLVVPRAEAEASLAAADAARRRVSEDEALRAWWPRRGDSTPGTAVGAALDALREFALRGEEPGAERGRLLAARIEAADPDALLEELVACGALPADVDPTPWRGGLADPFPEAALDEARRVEATDPDGSGREDLTGLFAVSVDDPETIEVDDALSVRRVEGGVEVLVHIADAAALVPAGGPLDAAVRARGSSLYAPDATYAMLPQTLVTARASLDAGRVREAVTGVFRVRDDGTVASSRFVRSLVRVARRLDYLATEDPASLAATPEDAEALVAACRALRAARVREGALVANLASLKIRAEGGVPSVARRHQDSPGDAVVAESAVLYNAEAGRLLASRDAAALFRVQPSPRGREPAADDPLRPVLVRRRFAPTQLRAEPSRHHGIGRDAYAQATSPLRRYADLVNQRQLLAVLAGAAPPYRPADVEALADHLSNRERAVRRAAAQREAVWLARWLQARGDRELEGALSRAPRRGLGAVWVADLLTELPLRAPDGWKPPPEGTVARWTIARLEPHRGRIELAPVS